MIRKTLSTKRLILRPYRRADYQTWKNAYVNRLPKKNRFDKGPLKPNVCGVLQFIKTLRRHEDWAKTDQTYVYGIFEKKNGILVGAIDIHIISRGDYQMGNLGYQIHNQYWGMGFGKEASKAGLKIGFSHLRLNRLEAAINIDNANSIKLAKSIGMRWEGIKKRYIFENKKWVDHIVFVANPADVGLPQTKPK